MTILFNSMNAGVQELVRFHYFNKPHYILRVNESTFVEQEKPLLMLVFKLSTKIEEKGDKLNAKRTSVGISDTSVSASCSTLNGQLAHS